MYLRKVHIENIRSIAELDWEIPEGREAGWHVVIGDNGAGKTTFLRAVALALIGQSNASALLQGWNNWLQTDKTEGLIELDLLGMAGYDLIPEKGNGTLAKIRFSRRRNAYVDDKWESIDALSVGALFGDEGIGWFSAAYGPFRRFSGGDQDSQKIFETHPRLGAHLSLFNEKFALMESLNWLHDLDYRKAKRQPEGALLDQVRDFINQEGLLPHHARLTDISPDAVIFTDGEGRQVPVEELSDGYRSVLSMTFELIRQMTRAYQTEKIFSADSTKIVAPGVVLIDEVDAHLHPTWQRSIGQWFRKHFPNIQFIVTTHSPLVCQAAERGTVFRLPAPGSGEKAEMVTGIALNRLLYGNVLDAYGTELFGEDVGRSEAGQKLLQQLAELNVKQVNQGLSKAEKKKQQELRATFPTSSAISNGQGKRRK